MAKHCSRAHTPAVCAATATTHSIKLWDVATGQEIATMPGHKRGVHHMVFSADGKTFVADDFYGSMKLWDVQTATIKAELEQTKRGEKVGYTSAGVWAISPILKTGRSARAKMSNGWTSPTSRPPHVTLHPNLPTLACQTAAETRAACRPGSTAAVPFGTESGSHRKSRSPVPPAGRFVHRRAA